VLGHHTQNAPYISISPHEYSTIFTIHTELTTEHTVKSLYTLCCYLIQGSCRLNRPVLHSISNYRKHYNH